LARCREVAARIFVSADRYVDMLWVGYRFAGGNMALRPDFTPSG